MNHAERAVRQFLILEMFLACFSVHGSSVEIRRSKSYPQLRVQNRKVQENEVKLRSISAEEGRYCGQIDSSAVGQNELHRAAFIGACNSTIKKLIEDGNPINKRNGVGLTPLHLALRSSVRCSSIGHIHELILGGADFAELIDRYDIGLLFLLDRKKDLEKITDNLILQELGHHIREEFHKPNSPDDLMDCVEKRCLDPLAMRGFMISWPRMAQEFWKILFDRSFLRNYHGLIDRLLKMQDAPKYKVFHGISRSCLESREGFECLETLFSRGVEVFTKNDRGESILHSTGLLSLGLGDETLRWIHIIAHARKQLIHDIARELITQEIRDRLFAILFCLGVKGCSKDVRFWILTSGIDLLRELVIFAICRPLRKNRKLLARLKISDLQNDKVLQCVQEAWQTGRLGESSDDENSVHSTHQDDLGYTSEDYEDFAYYYNNDRGSSTVADTLNNFGLLDTELTIATHRGLGCTHYPYNLSKPLDVWLEIVSSRILHTGGEGVKELLRRHILALNYITLNEIDDLIAQYVWGRFDYESQLKNCDGKSSDDIFRENNP